MKYFILSKDYYESGGFCKDFMDDYVYFKGHFPVHKDQSKLLSYEIRVVSRFRRNGQWTLQKENGTIFEPIQGLSDNLFMLK